VELEKRNRYETKCALVRLTVKVEVRPGVGGQRGEGADVLATGVHNLATHGTFSGWHSVF